MLNAIKRFLMRDQLDRARDKDFIDDDQYRKMVQAIPRQTPESIEELMEVVRESGCEVTFVGDFRQSTRAGGPSKERVRPFVITQMPWKIKEGDVLGRMWDSSGVADLVDTCIDDSSVYFIKRYVAGIRRLNKNDITYSGTSSGDGVYKGSWSFYSMMGDMATTGVFRIRTISSAKALDLKDIIARKDEADLFDYMRSATTISEEADKFNCMTSLFVDGTLSVDKPDGKWLMGTLVDYYVKNNTPIQVSSLYSVIASIEYRRAHGIEVPGSEAIGPRIEQFRKMFYDP